MITAFLVFLGSYFVCFFGFVTLVDVFAYDHDGYSCDFIYFIAFSFVLGVVFVFDNVHARVFQRVSFCAAIFLSFRVTYASFCSLFFSVFLRLYFVVLTFFDF